MEGEGVVGVRANPLRARPTELSNYLLIGGSPALAAPSHLPIRRPGNFNRYNCNRKSETRTDRDRDCLLSVLEGANLHSDPPFRPPLYQRASQPPCTHNSSYALVPSISGHSTAIPNQFTGR